MFHRKSREKIITEHLAQLNGKSYNYKLIQTAVRTVRLKINLKKGLEIIVPHGYNLRNVQRLFTEHEQWIEKQFKKLAVQKKIQEEHTLREGVVMNVLGLPHRVKILPPAKNGKPHVKRVQRLLFIEDRAIVDGHDLNVYCSGTVTQSKEALEQYLRPIAEKYFIKRTEELARLMNVYFKKITVRGQKTRWGSCTREKSLNFNWRLILLPPAVADSVIIHELAHTVHMNHSKAFYGLVERFCPDYRKLQKHLHNAHFMV